MIRTKPHFFWLIAFSIAIVSILISLYYIPPPPSKIYDSITSQEFFGHNFLEIFIKKSGIVNDALSFITEVLSRHHYHHKRRRGYRIRCNNNKWRSMLVCKYKVSHVLTVDLHGCGNFSSIQKAVDVVPEFSPSKTLIFIDSGTYRSFLCSDSFKNLSKRNCKMLNLVNTC